MSKQTAVQFVIEKIHFDANVRCFSKDEWKEIFEQAKQMEKEQIEDAFYFGWKEGVFYANKEPSDYESSEQYYNEIYGGENE
jgi:hypothetical protein